MKFLVAIKTILVFALLGPPIGSLVICLGSAVINPLPSPLSLALGNLVFLMVTAIPFSYVIGIVPALLVGTLTAIGENISQRFGFVHVVLLGLICGFIFAALFDRHGRSDLGYAVVKMLTCLVPTIGCWRISRRWHPKVNEQSHEVV